MVSLNVNEKIGRGRHEKCYDALLSDLCNTIRHDYKIKGLVFCSTIKMFYFYAMRTFELHPNKRSVSY